MPAGPLEARRRALPPADPWGAVAEWATPVLVQAGPPLALFRRGDGLERLAAPAEPVFAPGMVVRRVGEFVGRRAELRALLRVLRGADAGVVVHGIGGIGKSTLAAQLADQLGDEAGLVVAVSGAAALTVDLIIEALRTALLAHALEHGLDGQHPLRQVAAALTDASPPWRDRLELVRRVVLPRLPVLLLADNAEDLLTGGPDEREVADPDLAGFLAAWVQAAPRARLLVTSRYPFTLPGGAGRRLAWHHLGPLSLAETRKLIWRLPALDALPPPGSSAPTPWSAGTRGRWNTWTPCCAAAPPSSPTSPPGWKQPSPPGWRQRWTSAASPTPGSGCAASKATWTGRWPRPSRWPPTTSCSTACSPPCRTRRPPGS